MQHGMCRCMNMFKKRLTSSLVECIAWWLLIKQWGNTCDEGLLETR